MKSSHRNVGERRDEEIHRALARPNFNKVCRSERRGGTKDDQRDERAEARGWPLVCLLSFLLEDKKKKKRAPAVKVIKPFQSLINNSENKRHKSRLPKHLCFPRKSKFIETKSSACSTLFFFQTGILLRPQSSDVSHLSLQIFLSTQSFFFFLILLKHSKSK